MLPIGFGVTLAGWMLKTLIQICFLPMDFEGGTTPSENELTSQTKLAKDGRYFDSAS